MDSRSKPGFSKYFFSLFTLLTDFSLGTQAYSYPVYLLSSFHIILYRAFVLVTL